MYTLQRSIDVNVQHCEVVAAQQNLLKVNLANFPMNIAPGQGSDDHKMFVPTSDSGPKKLCCPYCKKRYLKFARHLNDVHKDEEDVKKFQALPLGKIFFVHCTTHLICR